AVPSLTSNAPCSRRKESTLSASAASPATTVVVPDRSRSDVNDCEAPMANRWKLSPPGMSRSSPTTTSVLAQLPPEQAVMVAVPALLPVTVPALTVAIGEALVDHVALAVRFVGCEVLPYWTNLSGNWLLMPSSSGSPGWMP